MNEVKRLALEICQKRSDISEEKKERIKKMLLDSRIAIPSQSSPSTSNGLGTSVNNTENTRVVTRFSKRRKIFGSDMCQNLGELKRETRWPSPACVLATMKETPKLTRQLSTIVSSKIPKEGQNGHAIQVNGHAILVNGQKSDNQNNMSFLSPRRNTIPSENEFKRNGHVLSLPTNNFEILSFDPSKYRKQYTLREVYRDLSLMRRTVSSCLAPQPTITNLTQKTITPDITVHASFDDTKYVTEDNNNFPNCDKIVMNTQNKELSNDVNQINSANYHDKEKHSYSNEPPLCESSNFQISKTDYSLNCSKDNKQNMEGNKTMCDEICDDSSKDLYSLNNLVLDERTGELSTDNETNKQMSVIEEYGDENFHKMEVKISLPTVDQDSDYLSPSASDDENIKKLYGRDEEKVHLTNTANCEIDDESSVNSMNDSEYLVCTVKEEGTDNTESSNKNKFGTVSDNDSVMSDRSTLSSNSRKNKEQKTETSGKDLKRIKPVYDPINITKKNVNKDVFTVLISSKQTYDNIYESIDSVNNSDKTNNRRKLSEDEMDIKTINHSDVTSKTKDQNTFVGVNPHDNISIDEDKSETTNEFKVNKTNALVKIDDTQHALYESKFKLTSKRTGGMALNNRHLTANRTPEYSFIKKVYLNKNRQNVSLARQKQEKKSPNKTYKKAAENKTHSTQTLKATTLNWTPKGFQGSVSTSLFGTCNCRKHRQGAEKQMKSNSIRKVNILKQKSQNTRLHTPSKHTSQTSRQMIDNKLCKHGGKLLEKNNKTQQNMDNYNSFNSCFKTLITKDTQSLVRTTNVSQASKDNCYTRVHGNHTRPSIQHTNNNKMSQTGENVKNLTFAGIEKDDEKDKCNDQVLSDDINDSVVEDSDDGDDLNDDVDINDKGRNGKYFVHSGKSRTEFTLSSGFGSRTPYSEYEYTDREVATDLISNIIDDVIDSVWQANVSKFKHHVCKTVDLTGAETVGCIVLVDEDKQPPLSFSCNVLNPSTYPTTVDTYELLIGNLIEVNISNDTEVREDIEFIYMAMSNQCNQGHSGNQKECNPGTKTRRGKQGFVKVAIPFDKSNMRFFHEPVLRAFDKRSNTWVSLDSYENIYFDENDSDLSVLEANIRDENIYVVVARPTTEHVTFNNDLVEYDSRIDSDVTLSSPIGSRVKTDNVSVKFTLLPISADTIIDTRDATPGDDSQSLVGSSPIIMVEQSYRNPQPLFISVPCEKPQANTVKRRLSSAPLPEDIMTQSRLSKYAMHDFIGTWSETESHLVRIGGCDRMKCQLMTHRDVTDDNKASFCIHEEKTTCFVMETRKEATRPNIHKIALGLLQIIKYQRVVVSVLQNKDVIQDLTVTCDLRTRYATRWRRRLEQEYDVTSKMSSLKEGDIISFNLRGNLTSLGKRFHIFRFHGSQSVAVNWNLQVVDRYSQRSLEFYYGFVQLLNLKAKSKKFEEVKSVDGHDWDTLLEIPVRLPKHQIGSIPPPIKARLQMVEEGPVTLQFLSSIAECLADQWMTVASTLQISHARLQSLKRQNINNNKQLVKDLLHTWFKNMPHAKDKTTMLVSALNECGKQSLADTLAQETEKYNRQKSKLATEYGLLKTLNTLIKSPSIVLKWKQLATELGYSLEEINLFHNSATSEEERCSKMLTNWCESGDVHSLRILARCSRRIGCKYVADHLLSVLVKQKQLRCSYSK